MLSAQVLQDIAANPGTNGYAISARLGVNPGTVQRLLTREFARNDLLEFGRGGSPGARGAVTVRLTVRGERLLEAVRGLFGPMARWNDDLSVQVNGLDETITWIGRDSKVFDRADQRRGRFDWVRMVKLDPEPAAYFPDLRETSRNWPVLEAIATGKLRSIVLGATLDRIKARRGLLTLFIK